MLQTDFRGYFGQLPLLKVPLAALKNWVLEVTLILSTYLQSFIDVLEMCYKCLLAPVPFGLGLWHLCQGRWDNVYIKIKLGS